MAIFIAGLMAAVATTIAAYGVHHHRVRAASLVSQGGQQVAYPDGRGIRIIIAGNDNDRTAVVLVLHQGTSDPQRQVLQEARSYSTSDPLEGLRSSARLTTRYPPDPDVSGLWIDGHKRPVTNSLTVIYISDKLPATELPIPEQDQPQFLNDAQKLDPLLLVDKWIKPQVPAARRNEIK